MKSNRILTIVLAVTITPFAAVAQARAASKDGATTPKAPVLASVRGSGDAAELDDILAVPTPVPRGCHRALAVAPRPGAGNCDPAST